MLANDTIGRLLEKQFEHFAKNQTLNFHGQFTTLVDLERLTINSILQAKQGFKIQFMSGKDNLEFVFGNQRLKIPKIIDHEIFFQKEPFSVADIKGLITDKGKLDIARQFVISGFLEVVKI